MRILPFIIFTVMIGALALSFIPGGVSAFNGAQETKVSVDPGRIISWIKEIPQMVWNFFVEKIIGILTYIMELWISFLQGIRDMVYFVFWGIAGVEGEIYESGWGNVILTFNVIVSTLLLLGLMGIVRLWIFILDVAPII